MVKIAIIGAGAAGLIAAHFAAQSESAAVTLFEKNSFPGKKILITGKGRCNVTNAAEIGTWENEIPRGSKFLRTALYAFSPDKTRRFLEEAGVALKVERGGRVFPVSDRARDVADALTRRALESPRTALKTEKVLSVCAEDGLFSVQTEKETLRFDRVLIATGGASYPGTGSDGDGYRFARRLGHRITPLSPSLIPLLAQGDLCPSLMGLSLKNIAIRIETGAGKKVYEDFGEMLFSHFGVSGPVILSASAYLDFEKEPFYRLWIDLKPALSEADLDRRILSDFEENKNRDLVNSLSRLLPQKLIRPSLALAQLEERKKVNLITKEERRRLVCLLKKFPVTLTGTRPLKEAIVTRGGVDLSEIDPRTMQSRKIPGLFFAGEILDADGLTGGYNLQIAFSTGYLAGKNISKEES